MAASARETFTMARQRMQRSTYSVERRLPACSRRQLADDTSSEQKGSERCLEAFRQAAEKQAARLCSPAKDAPLRFSEAHRANQSLPLKPAQPKNTEQATRDRRRLRNDRAIYLDVIDSDLEIVAIGLPTGEQQSQDEIVYVESRSGRDQESYNSFLGWPGAQ